MVHELDALVDRIAQVATLCRNLRAENSELRQQLAAAESERRVLVERMDAARTRLEQLAQQIPEAKS